MEKMRLILLFISMTTLGVGGEGARFTEDAIGTGLCVWEDEATATIRYSALTDLERNRWSSTRAISQKNQRAFHPVFAVNSLGHAVVVWCVKDAKLKKRSLYASFIPHQGRPERAVMISSRDENVLDDYSVTLDDEGSAVVIWRARYPGHKGINVHSNTASFAGKWNASTMLN